MGGARTPDIDAAGAPSSSLTSPMSLSLDVRRVCLFLLVSGVFVPLVLGGDIGVCQPGWEWVSGPVYPSMLTLFEFPWWRQN